MKKIVALILTLIMCLVAFASCIEGGSYVVDASYDDEGNLILEYSNGRTQNIGRVTEDDGLEYYPLPDGTYAVGKGNTQFLEEIVIPSTHNGKPVTKIAKDAFLEAKNLKKVTISEGIQIIGENAFRECSKLETVVLSTGVTTIEKNAFANCNVLKEINLPNTVTTISLNAFSYCYKLERIVIPSSVVDMGNIVFAGSNTINIFCELPSKPDNWKSTWNAGQPVTWGYVAEQP